MEKQNTNGSRPIVVGKKSVSNYALAVVTRLGQGEDKVVLRARGQSIGIAFDAANMTLNMGQPVSRGNVRWGQELAPGGKNVSFVEIELNRR